MELSRLMRLTDTETRQLAGLAGHVVELELGLNIDIARDGSARVLYQHDLVNLNEKPLGRVTREVWFQYVDTSITITPTQHNDRRIVIQRIRDAGSLAKFAFTRLCSRVSEPRSGIYAKEGLSGMRYTGANL